MTSGAISLFYCAYRKLGIGARGSSKNNDAMMLRGFGLPIVRQTPRGLCLTLACVAAAF
jgi:hypothetical protein